MFLALVGVLALPRAGDATVIVSLAPSAAAIAPGAALDLELRADLSMDAVVGFGLDLVFDPTVLALEGVSIAAPWDFVFAPDGDGLAALAPLAGAPAGSDVLLATVTLRAVALGDSSVSVATTPGDLTEGFPLASPPGAFAALSSETALVTVPESGGLGLATFALLWLSRRRRRLAALLLVLLAATPLAPGPALAEVKVACESGSSGLVPLPFRSGRVRGDATGLTSNGAVGRAGDVILREAGPSLVEVFTRDDGFAMPTAAPIRAELAGRGGDVFIQEVDPPTRWDVGVGARPLPLPPGFEDPVIEALTRDAETAVGFVERRREDFCLTTDTNEVRGAVWQGAESVELLQAGSQLDAVAAVVIAEDISSAINQSVRERRTMVRTRLRDVSEDGRVVVGQIQEQHFAVTSGGFCSRDDTIFCVTDDECPGTDSCIFIETCRTFTGSYPARWKDGGAQALFPMPANADASISGTAAVSNADGSVVAGNVSSAFGGGAFRWSERPNGGQTEILSLIPGTGSPEPTGISADGQRIVGNLSLSDFGLRNFRCRNGCIGGREAFVWDAGLGMRFLSNALASDHGVDVSGWHLSKVRTLRETLDGVLLVGDGIAPDGSTTSWWIEIPCSDADGDGLCSLWETMGGIDLDGDGAISPCTPSGCPDLVLTDADPLVKDVYVELDQLRTADPLLPAALRELEEAFASVPDALVDNVGDRHGIRLHLELDEVALEFDDGTVIWGFPSTTCDGTEVVPEETEMAEQHFGSVAQRANAAVRRAKARVYRYGVYGGVTPCNIKGQGQLGGPYFFVAETTDWGLHPAQDRAEAQAAMLMHELGHTFNRNHGGTDAINFKPNYHSVMNYLWNLPGGGRALDTLAGKAWTGSWRLDYSRRAFFPLRESAPVNSITGVSEFQGIGGHFLHWVPIGPVTHAQVVREFGPVDFDNDGTIESERVGPLDLNNIYSGVPPSPLQDLRGANDWAAIAADLCPLYRQSNWAAPILNASAGGPSLAIERIGDRVIVEAPEVSFMDCNSNGVVDDQDLADGLDTDADDNGWLDGCEPLLGDVDLDEDVDEADRALLLAAFGYGEGEPEYNGIADLDDDQWVTFVDYQLWLAAYEDFQADAVAGTTAVEPACGLLGAEALAPLALWALARRRRRGGSLDA